MYSMVPPRPYRSVCSVERFWNCSGAMYPYWAFDITSTNVSFRVDKEMSRSPQREFKEHQMEYHLVKLELLWNWISSRSLLYWQNHETANSSEPWMTNKNKDYRGRVYTRVSDPRTSKIKRSFWWRAKFRTQGVELRCPRYEKMK